jgi:hypothetical protein
MIQMQTGCAESDAAAAKAEVDQPLAERTILPTVAHVEVEPIHGDDRVPPGRGVVSVPRRARRGDRVEDRRNGARARQANDATASLPAVSS